MGVSSGWRLAVGRRWRLAAVGGWRLVAVGAWWRLAVGGGWWLAVDGRLGRSLRGVLEKKNLGPKGPPWCARTIDALRVPRSAASWGLSLGTLRSCRHPRQCVACCLPAPLRACAGAAPWSSMKTGLATTCMEGALMCAGRERRVEGGGGWHKASVSDCLPLAAPVGLSPLLILTLCGPERVLVVRVGGGGSSSFAADLTSRRHLAAMRCN